MGRSTQSRGGNAAHQEPGGVTVTGQRSAVFYGLLGSCLRRGINPRDYLHWLFARLPVTMPVDHPSLTPAAYAAAQQPAAAAATLVAA
jgi:hypothetical protein